MPSHVARSGVSERSPTLVDSRQWSCPCPLSVPFPTQGPFPRRALPRVSGTTGPIRHPAGPACPSRGPGCRMHDTGRASRVATLSIFHTCRRHYPGGNQPVVPSLFSRPVGGLPLSCGGTLEGRERGEGDMIPRGWVAGRPSPGPNQADRLPRKRPGNRAPGPAHSTGDALRRPRRYNLIGDRPSE